VTVVQKWTTALYTQSTSAITWQVGN